MSEYAEWDETLARIVETGGTTLLLGGTDVGKTTFARALANAYAESGQNCAVLDGDLGQSEIGPPACLGIGRVEAEKPIRALSEIAPETLRFLGTTSPQGFSLEFAVGMRSLADTLPSASPLAVPSALRFPLIVDTGGYLHGAWAVRLFFALTDLLKPAHLVALQRKDELSPFLTPLRFRELPEIHRLPIPEVIAKKPPKYRAQRRALKFASFFQNAQELSFSFDEVALGGTWLGSGEPVAAHIQKFIASSLGVHNKVYYAELSSGVLGVMSQKAAAPQSPALAQIAQTLKVESVAVTPAPQLKHLLVGLEGASGRFLALGSLSSLDFRRRTLGVLTTLPAGGAVRGIRFGSIRVTPEGEEVKG